MKGYTLTWYYVGKKICYINPRALTRLSYNPKKKIKPKMYSINLKEDIIFRIWWKLVTIE